MSSVSVWYGVPARAAITSGISAMNASGVKSRSTSYGIAAVVAGVMVT